MHKHCNCINMQSSFGQKSFFRILLFLSFTTKLHRMTFIHVRTEQNSPALKTLKWHNTLIHAHHHMLHNVLSFSRHIVQTHFTPTPRKKASIKLCKSLKFFYSFFPICFEQKFFEFFFFSPNTHFMFMHNDVQSPLNWGDFMMLKVDARLEH